MDNLILEYMNKTSGWVTDFGASRYMHTNGKTLFVHDRDDKDPHGEHLIYTGTDLTAALAALAGE